MKKLDLERTLIMGIVNVTPDSFFDGGRYAAPDAAVAHMRQLAGDGADILDIGAASSRPGCVPLTAGEELARLEPLLARVDAAEFPPLSIDTDKPEVAAAALAAGFTILNDTGRPSARMAALAAEHGAYLVIMFRGPFSVPDPDGMMMAEEVKQYFSRGIEMALSCGVSQEHLILDPGIGFGMDAAQSALLTAYTGEFTAFGLPLLLGMSNKRFIGGLGGAELADRLPGNIAAELFGVEQGAAILRVHDAAATAQALRVYRMLRKLKRSGNG